MIKLKSLSAKYLFISAVLLLFFGVFTYFSFVITSSMTGDARKINIAGRERMLTYLIASRLHFITQSPTAADRKRHSHSAELAMEEYEEALLGLKSGSVKLELEPVHEHDLVSKVRLNELIDLWQNVQRPLLRDIMQSGSPGKAEYCNDCHAAVRENIIKIEAIAKSIETHHERELVVFNRFRIGAIGVLVMITALLFLYTRRSLIQPAMQLKKAAEEIEKGNFDISVEVRTRDEIGGLSASFNSMARRLKDLFTEKAEHLHELNMLNEIALAASQTLELEAMFDKVMDALLSLAPLTLLHKGAIFLYNTDNKVLKMVRSHNLNEEQVRRCASVSYGECLCGLCAKQEELVLSESSDYDRWHEITYAEMKAHGHVVLPLKARNKLLGVLCLYLPDGKKLSDREVKLYRSIADILAVSIQNALNHKQVAMLAQSLDSSRDLIVITDVEGMVLHVNPRVDAYLGYTLEELTGRHISLMRSPKVAVLWEEIQRATLNDGGWSGESINIRKDGGEYPVFLSLSPVKYEHNDVIAMIGIIRDISDQKRAEDVLRQSEQRYRLLFDLLPYGGEVLDKEGHIIDCSLSNLRLLGYERDELIGKNIAELLTPQSVTVLREKFPQLMQGTTVQAEVRMVRKDGRVIDVARAAQPIFSADGNIIGALALSVDITDKKAAEEENRRLQAQFLQSQKMETVGRLAGGVAHDFNNLLTVIIGYSDIMMRTLPIESPLRERLVVICDAGQKAAALTRQLLAFSRKQTLELKVVSLNDIIENTVKMLARMIGEDFSLEPTLKATWFILADSGQIEQILMNLAVNARDAMPCGGMLTLGTEDIHISEEYARGYADMKPGDYVILSVTDTGTGMSKEVQARIFEPFFTTKELGKGTGLGLATVFGIVKQHGGHILVDSELDRGTTFKIYLPAVSSGIPKTLEREDVAPTRGNETIMVVDDEQSVRTFIKDALLQLGYRVIASSCGEEALQSLAAEEKKPELLLTDAIMPNMNGKDLADAARKMLPSIKVIFMSGYPDESIAHHGILIPGVVFIQKPLMLSSLARMVREVLDGK